MLDELKENDWLIQNIEKLVPLPEKADTDTKLKK